MSILLINIIALIAANIEARTMKMSELFAGDIVNIKYLNFESTEVYGDIFNNRHTSYLIKNDDFTGIEQTSIEKKACVSLEDLLLYYNPKIMIKGRRFLSFEIKNDKNNYNFFGFDPEYIHDNYSYGIVKVCRIVNHRQVIADVIDKNHLPVFVKDYNYKLLLDKTGVLRFKDKNQTHYVSDIITGECFVQVYANDAELCRKSILPKLNITNFIESSRYKSRIKTTNGNLNHEVEINDYINTHGMTLLHLNYSTQSFYEKFKFIYDINVIELNLMPLLDPPCELPSSSFTHDKFLVKILPGDVINVNELKHIDSQITTDSFLVDVSDHKTSAFTDYNYTDCHIFNENDTVNIKYTPYELHSNYFTEFYYKFDVLEELVKQKNYGVDPKYLTNKYKCLKVKICSEFKRRMLIIPSVYVINLSKYHTQKLHIFENKNIVLRYALANETHYVTRTEKGNCLFQALMYQNLGPDNKQSPLLYKGKILSANKDLELEKWAEELVNDLPMSTHKTLMNLINNQTALTEVYSKFAREDYAYTLINIYLDKLN